MFVVISVSLLALFLTYLDVIGIKRGMLFGFIAITILGCIHFNYGNDYVAYYELYQNIVNEPFNLRAIWDGDVFHDPGWVFLNYLFEPLGGFFTLVAVLNILQNVIVYKFITRYVDKKWWVLAVFIYLFCTDFYLLNFSMMRQGLVVSLFLFSWVFIKEKRWLVSLVILYFASLIHISAILLLPFAFWGFLPIKNRKILVTLFLLIFVLLFSIRGVVSNLLELFLSVDDFQMYAVRYGDNNEIGSRGVGFIIKLIPLMLSFVYLIREKQAGDADFKLVMLSLCAFLILPFSSEVSTIGRIAIYFSIFNLAAIPLVYSKIRSTPLKFSLISLFVLITLYDYMLFFQSPVFAKAYSSFHTIFEVM